MPWRGATGYFCSKGGLRKMAYPLGARSRFDAKPGIHRKNKTRPNLESFLVRAWTSSNPAAQGCVCGKRRRRSEKFTPVNQWIEQKFIADFARGKDRFRERTPVCLRRRLEDGGKGPTPARMHQLLPTCGIRFYVTDLLQFSSQTALNPLPHKCVGPSVRRSW